MWLQYFLAALLITAVFVFGYRKVTHKKETLSVSGRKKTKKSQLVHSETGLTMDDHFRLDKRHKEMELNDLLDKVRAKGFDSLSEKEKQRLNKLSESI